MAQDTGTAKGFAGTEAVVTITIGSNGQISVDNDPITLSKGKGHRATWRLQGGAGWEFAVPGESVQPKHSEVPGPASKRHGRHLQVHGAGPRLQRPRSAGHR